MAAGGDAELTLLRKLSEVQQGLDRYSSIAAARTPPPPSRSQSVGGSPATPAEARAWAERTARLEEALREALISGNTEEAKRLTEALVTVLTMDRTHRSRHGAAGLVSGPERKPMGAEIRAQAPGVGTPTGGGPISAQV